VGRRLRLGEGLSGRVAQARQPLFVDDYRTYPGRSDQYAGADFRAVAGVPLLYGDEVLGVLTVLHGAEGRTFREADVTLLQSLANQAAVAIANARLFEETRRWSEQLAALQELSRNLGTRLELRETLETLIHGLGRLIPHRGGEVCIYDPERQCLVAMATLGEVARVASAESYSLTEGYTGWIARNRKPLLISDCVTFTEARPKREEVLSSGGLRSFLGAPMLLGERLIGTIELISDQPGAFTDEHLRLLTLVAGEAASAIDNARLYELTERRLRKRIEQLVALRRVGQEMNSTLELEHNLQVLIEEAVRATSATHGHVAMYDPAVGAYRVGSAYMGYTSDEARLLRQLRLGRGRSVVDDVLRSGQPEMVRDASLDPRPICVKRETRAGLFVPILYEGRVVGVIDLLSTEERAFDEEDLQFAQTMATQASLAVGNARRYEELVQEREQLGQRASQLHEILELGNTLRADQELPDLLGQVAYGVVGSVGFGVVLFQLASETDPSYLERVASAGIPLEDFQRLREVRPARAAFEALFRDEFRISRSYLVPHEVGLAAKQELTYLFPVEQEDTQDEEMWRPGDLLLVPLYSGTGEFLGVMSVDNPFDRRRPSRRTIEVLEIFANQAAVAAENARLFRERERRIAELNALNRIAQAAASTLDPDAVLRAIYDRLAEARVLDVEGFFITIHDPARERFRYYPLVVQGRLCDAEERPVEGLAARVLESRQPLVVENLASWQGPADIFVGQGEGARSLLAVPLWIGEQAVGVMAAASSRQSAYGPRERQFLLTVANQVAVAIQNASLFREREQRLAELAILNEIGRALSSAL
ncbi:MAG: GAF domain-containing protein, partial [Chloroflexia bacterium]